MKHNVSVTLILLGAFLLAQVVGLTITNNYYDPIKTAQEGQIVFEELPFSFERPEPIGASGIIYLFIAVLIGTALMLLLIRWKARWAIRTWFLFAIALTSVFALAAFVSPTIAAVVGIGLAVWRVYRPNIIVQNLTEIFLYGGLAAIFVPFISTVFYAAIILVLISIYDAYAVWKSKHMIILAESQKDIGVFAGLMIPYGKAKSKKTTKKKTSKKKVVKTTKAAPAKTMYYTRTAILGGGDIGFPLLFSGVVLTQVGFLKTLFVTAGATIALGFLLFKGKENRYYPAMPFLSLGCFVGYAIIWLLL